MALRAGYYGIKKQLKQKLTEIAASWDDVKHNVDGVEYIQADYGEVTLNSLGYTGLTIPSVSNKYCAGYSLLIGGTGSAVYSALSATYDNTSKMVEALRLKNLDATNGHTWTVLVNYIFIPFDMFTFIDTTKNNKSIAEDDPEISEDIAIKKTTTRKKSTAKAETTEEV